MFNLLVWLLFKKQNMKIVALGHIDAESLQSLKGVQTFSEPLHRFISFG